MELNKILTAGLDDVIFIGRNKSYGAYLLRQVYGKHMVRGFIISLSLFLVCLGGPVIWKKFHHEKIEIAKVELVDMANIKPPPPVDPKTPPPPPPPPPPPLKTTVKFTPPVIKKDEEVHEDPPKQEELKKVEVSDETKKGNDNGVASGPPDEPVVEETSNKVWTFVEQKPQFEGGEAGMMKFIQSHLNYPQQAKDQEIEGRVILTFVVDETGGISDVKILRDIGGGCGQAAVDVVKKLPKGTPAKQNGKAVKYQYNLPVVFQLQ